MKPTEPASLGPVKTEVARIELPSGGLRLQNGETLPELTVAYETYGRLAPERDNAVFICHALSGDAHVAGYHDPSLPATAGWWNNMVGPGKGIDTDHYFVICANILGGCMGTTGPSSGDPRTGKPYGSTFPPITVTDIVNVHRLLVKSLGVERLAAVVGGSFGGMQAMEWAIRFPEMIDRCICIASAARLSAQALAFDIVGRKAILSDPAWQGGDYYGTGQKPASGLALARKIGHITYLSRELMAEKFGRDRKEGGVSVLDVMEEAGQPFLSDFQIESYLEHQGRKFVDRFDANSYLHITRAMDEYDLGERFGSLENAFEPLQAKMLVVALSADWLFPSEQSMEIANALLRAGKHVSYCNLHAPQGHDGFLVEVRRLSEVIKAFLPWVRSLPIHSAAGDAGAADGASPEARHERRAHDVLAGMIRPGSRVLDLGCGGGELLSELSRRCQVSGIGVDIDLDNVIQVIDRGHDVFQNDIDAGLAMIPDGAYDYAILSETMQVVHKPRFVLREIQRVARRGIVSFPNFGQWSHRLHLWTTGRMPKGGALPFEWYDTPNIHLFTLRDFVDLCREDDITILSTACLTEGWLGRALVRMGFRNLGADHVLVEIAGAADLRDPGPGEADGEPAARRCRSCDSRLPEAGAR